MNTIDEMIEVLQAMKEGKAIETRPRDERVSEWVTSSTKCPDFTHSEYRVKKEPMVIWGVVWPDNCVVGYETEDLANERAIYCGGTRVAKFIEVME